MALPGRPEEDILHAGWKIRGRELRLVDPEGNETLPTAADIYRALVEGSPTESWIPTAVEELRASRYPLSPTFTIIEAGKGIPAYAIYGTAMGKTLELETEDLERGYTVIGGIWYPIEPSSAREVLELLHSTGADIGPARSLRTFLAVRKAAASCGVVNDRLMDEAISPLVFAPAADDVPSGVNASLYSYQLTGWRWLKFLLGEGIGGLLADEMGLGKTLQIIAAISDSGSGPLRPVLIVAPGSLLENWRREIARFAPHLQVLKHHGPLRTGSPSQLQDYDVVVTSYDNAVGDNSLLSIAVKVRF